MTWTSGVQVLAMIVMSYWGDSVLRPLLRGLTSSPIIYHPRKHFSSAGEMEWTGVAFSDPMTDNCKKLLLPGALPFSLQDPDHLYDSVFLEFKPKIGTLGL